MRDTHVHLRNDPPRSKHMYRCRSKHVNMTRPLIERAKVDLILKPESGTTSGETNQGSTSRARKPKASA